MHSHTSPAPTPYRFWKGQALGNDYVVIDSGLAPSVPVIRGICDRHKGVGSDGLLVGGSADGGFRLRIFNPDGTEAEKSGNGLRIFGAWLHLRGLVGDAPFPVRLPGETVSMEVKAVEPDGTRIVAVAMGDATFRAGAVGYSAAGPEEEVLGVQVEVDGAELLIHLVSLGNPHCVVFLETLDAASFRRLAPRLQSLPAFERGVNVQFARVAAPDTLEAFIWERGAGETLASGSSACAVVAAALRSRRVDGRRFQVRMPGGTVEVEVDAHWAVRLTGGAQIVFEGEIAGDVLRGWASSG